MVTHPVPSPSPRIPKTLLCSLLAGLSGGNTGLDNTYHSWPDRLLVLSGRCFLIT